MRTLTLVLLVAACGSKAAAPATTTTPSNESSELANTAPAPAAPAGLAVTAIEPDKGNTDGGTYVRIKGAHFIDDGPRNAKIYFGSRQGTVIRFASDSELIVEAPGGKPGEVVDVLLIFEPGGELKLPRAFTYVEKNDSGPSINDLNTNP